MDANDTNRPAEGWSGPDERGYMEYTMHGPSFFVDPPVLDGFEAYWIGVHGESWTRWVYRPVPAKD